MNDIVPIGTGFGAQQPGRHGHRGARQPHHGEVGQGVGDHHIGAAAEHQNRAIAAVERAQCGDDLLGRHAGDDASRHRADPQRCQRGQRNVRRDLRAAEILHAR